METAETDSSRERPEVGKFRLWLAKRKQNKVHRHLDNVYSCLENFDFTQADEPTNSCEGFRHFSRDKEYGRLGTVALIDGMAVIFTTKGKDADLSHKFIFPREKEEVVYQNESFNIDEQATAAASVCLSGIEAVASDRKARRQLAFVDMSLQYEVIKGRIAEPVRGTMSYARDQLAYMSE